MHPIIGGYDPQWSTPDQNEPEILGVVGAVVPAIEHVSRAQLKR